jgi:hypothetical protein
VLEVGVLYACPVQRSSCLTPYLRDKYYADTLGARRLAAVRDPRSGPYLRLSRLAPAALCKKPVKQKPRLFDAGDDLWWELDSPKTCPQRYFDCMQIEAIGRLPIDMAKARARFAKRSRPGIVYLGWSARWDAINDITIADCMNPSSHDWHLRYEPKGLVPDEGPTMMRSLGELLT